VGDDPMESPPCLLTVHAHPDDEASKGSRTVALYHSLGVRTVLVCCTGGEEGDILNPAMDRPEVRENLHQFRMRELAAAAAIIGYDEVVLLGYRDSGMPNTRANEHPDCFANADLDEAVGRLVRVIRRERPQVITTYADERSTSQHPDHLRVHDISVAAFDRAGGAGYRSELGEPWDPTKLYYWVRSAHRIRERHAAFLQLGLKSPYDQERLARPSQDDLITTQIAIGVTRPSGRMHYARTRLRSIRTRRIGSAYPTTSSIRFVRSTTTRSPAVRSQSRNPNVISSPGYASRVLPHCLPRFITRLPPVDL
jgi:mycothiol S-conjugate amidase